MSNQFSASTPVPAVFQFENLTVRSLEIDGDPWFVAKDVADILGYVNTAKAIRTHCKHSKPVGVPNSVTPHEYNPQTVIIHESDVYRLIVRSTMPIADKFETWIMDDVIPSIRKHGHYSTASAPVSLPTQPMELLFLAVDSIKQLNERTLQIESRTSQVEDIVLDTANRFDEFEANRGLETWQAFAVKQEMQAKVHALFEKYGINRSMLFSSCWGFLKRHFRVPTYSAIPSRRYDETMLVVKGLSLDQLPPTIIELARGTKRVSKPVQGVAK